jgi:aminopeptidase N
MSEILYDGTAYGKCTGFIKQLYKAIGPETMSAGFKIYFQRYLYKTSTFEDVINCMAEAFKQRDPAINMGPDFNMEDWLRCWLQETSGINTLEPVLEIDDFTG